MPITDKILLCCVMIFIIHLSTSIDKKLNEELAQIPTTMTLARR